LRAIREAVFFAKKFYLTATHFLLPCVFMVFIFVERYFSELQKRGKVLIVPLLGTDNETISWLYNRRVSSIFVSLAVKADEVLQS
jgi:hypothetical protein